MIFRYSNTYHVIENMSKMQNRFDKNAGIVIENSDQDHLKPFGLMQRTVYNVVVF